MELLRQLASSTELPFISAFLLGLMTAVSPCPLATNISAIGFISKDLEDRRRVFLNGVYYTLGRAVSYSVLGAILIFILKQGASTYRVQKLVSVYGERIIGPLLILIGLFLLGVFKLNFSFLGKLSSSMENRAKKGSPWSALLLGVVFALAFCPYSGILYFGGLIPLAASSTAGYLLPLVFAVATGLPVIVFAWILAFSVSKMSAVYNKVKTVEFWFRKVIAIIFIGVGLYYCWIVFLK
ncbi:MAG: sulfite exporter TauE/SafE family protein [Bacteroidales bacterium]|jgi:cytochrome c biogenesis protein CcdA|nr:sulfite exporter TauE/SafE family protein [Bacteroidales bacterium]